jgi:hypothetical protein
MMTEEKTDKLEAEVKRLRGELEKAKKKRAFLTTSEVNVPDLRAPAKSSPFISTGSRPGVRPAPLQTHNLKKEASDERAVEILERVKTARKGK